jgi:hypothetical protein
LTVKSSGGTNCSLGQTLYTVDGVGGGASQLNTVVTPSGGSAAFTVQSQNQLFSLTLTGNVAGSPVSFIGVIAPALVTFQITEDGGGAHTFSWPSNVIGAAAIDTTANHSTSQTFIWNGATIMPVGSGFTSTGNTLFAGSVNPILSSAINNAVYVDGCLGVASPRYACSPAGIQAAITDATAGCRPVLIPPTNGAPIAMGGTQITIPPCVKVSGAGMKQTILQWTSNLASGAIGMTSPVGSYLGNLELSFNSGNTSDAIRINASDAAPALDNTVENILIDFSTLGGPGSAGIHATGSGPSNTDIVLNTFRNIIVQTADHAVVCTNCEGNYWQVVGQNLGAQINSTLFTENGLNADEVGDIRMESGSGNFANETCYSTSGSNNIIRLTCDGNLTGITAVSDTGGWNIFDLNTVGTPTLGTISANSQYRYVNSANGGNILGVSQLTLNTGVSKDGGGFKHKRVASCTTAASGNATCATTVTWTTAFADANYTLSCTLIGPGTAFVLESGTPVAASATVTIMNAPGSTTAASGTLDCVAVHD